jgi:hypothetical protein
MSRTKTNDSSYNLIRKPELGYPVISTAPSDIYTTSVAGSKTAVVTGVRAKGTRATGTTVSTIPENNNTTPGAGESSATIGG